MSDTTTISLPLGIPYVKDGESPRLVQDVKIRKFNANDKVDCFGLAKRDPIAAAAEFVSRVLRGPKLSRAEVMLQIPVADRDFILREVYRYTRGDKVKWQINCGHSKTCGEPNELDVDLSTIEVTEPKKKDIRIEIYNEIPEVWYDIDLSDVGGELITLKYPTSDEGSKISKIAKKNELQATYELYSLCLRKWGDKDAGKKGFNKNFVQELTDMTLLDTLEARVKDHTYGLEQIHTFRCIDCNRQTKFIADMLSFLFRNPLLT